MLEKRKLTILVVPSSPHQKVFSVPMPVLALTVLFLVSGILSLMASAGAWSMVRLHQLQQESHHLAVENRAAKSQIQDQETRIEYLTREISSIREKAGYV
ncbi:MAG: hypothetical protein MUC98_10290, partial [Desulfobacterota bacterium]|nr:hypothetical protein [Thermodesulfobacteriota bacterium]